MSVLDLLFVGLLSAAILFLLFGLLYIVLSLSNSRKVRALKKRKVKNKRKRKKLLRTRRELEQKVKRQRNGWILCLVICLLASGGSFYARYYQLTTLTVEDTEAVAKGYYLTDEMNKQILSIENGTSPEKVTKNLSDLTSQLGSVTVREASQGLSVEGQRMVNKHFSMLRNLSVNISKLTRNDLESEEKRKEYLSDIARIKENEQKLFKEFSINESALKQQ